MEYITLSYFQDGRPSGERIVLREDFSYEEYEECEILRIMETKSTWIRTTITFPIRKNKKIIGFKGEVTWICMN